MFFSIAAVWSVAEYGQIYSSQFVFVVEPNPYNPFYMAPEPVTEMICGQQPDISGSADKARKPLPRAFFIGGWLEGMRTGDLEEVIRAKCGTGPREIHDKRGSKKVIMRTAEEATAMIDLGDFELACAVDARNPQGTRKVRARPWWPGGRDPAGSQSDVSSSASETATPVAAIGEPYAIMRGTCDIGVGTSVVSAGELAEAALEVPVGILADVALAIDGLEADMQSSLAFLRGRVELAALISKGRDVKPSLPLGERLPGCRT